MSLSIEYIFITDKDIWLVNALVDSYILTRSPRCLEIITAVSEPHDKVKVIDAWEKIPLDTK